MLQEPAALPNDGGGGGTAATVTPHGPPFDGKVGTSSRDTERTHNTDSKGNGTDAAGTGGPPAAETAATAAAGGPFNLEDVRTLESPEWSSEDEMDNAEFNRQFRLKRFAAIRAQVKKKDAVRRARRSHGNDGRSQASSAGTAASDDMSSAGDTLRSRNTDTPADLNQTGPAQQQQRVGDTHRDEAAAIPIPAPPRKRPAEQAAAVPRNSRPRTPDSNASIPVDVGHPDTAAAKPKTTTASHGGGAPTMRVQHRHGSPLLHPPARLRAPARAASHGKEGPIIAGTANAATAQDAADDIPVSKVAAPPRLVKEQRRQQQQQAQAPVHEVSGGKATVRASGATVSVTANLADARLLSPQQKPVSLIAPVHSSGARQAKKSLAEQQKQQQQQRVPNANPVRDPAGPLPVFPDYSAVVELQEHTQKHGDNYGDSLRMKEPPSAFTISYRATGKELRFYDNGGYGLLWDDSVLGDDERESGPLWPAPAPSKEPSSRGQPLFPAAPLPKELIPPPRESKTVAPHLRFSPPSDMAERVASDRKARSASPAANPAPGPQRTALPPFQHSNPRNDNQQDAWSFSEMPKSTRGVSATAAVPAPPPSSAHNEVKERSQSPSLQASAPKAQSRPNEDPLGSSLFLGIFSDDDGYNWEHFTFGATPPSKPPPLSTQRAEAKAVPQAQPRLTVAKPGRLVDSPPYEYDLERSMNRERGEDTHREAVPVFPDSGSNCDDDSRHRASDRTSSHTSSDAQEKAHYSMLDESPLAVNRRATRLADHEPITSALRLQPMPAVDRGDSPQPRFFPSLSGCEMTAMAKAVNHKTSKAPLGSRPISRVPSPFSYTHPEHHDEKRAPTALSGGGDEESGMEASGSRALADNDYPLATFTNGARRTTTTSGASREESTAPEMAAVTSSAPIVAMQSEFSPMPSAAARLSANSKHGGSKGKQSLANPRVVPMQRRMSDEDVGSASKGPRVTRVGGSVAFYSFTDAAGQPFLTSSSDANHDSVVVKGSGAGRPFTTAAAADADLELGDYEDGAREAGTALRSGGGGGGGTEPRKWPPAKAVAPAPIQQGDSSADFGLILPPRANRNSADRAASPKPTGPPKRTNRDEEFLWSDNGASFSLAHSGDYSLTPSTGEGETHPHKADGPQNKDSATFPDVDPSYYLYSRRSSGVDEYPNLGGSTTLDVAGKGGNGRWNASGRCTPRRIGNDFAHKASKDSRPSSRVGLKKSKQHRTPSPVYSQLGVLAGSPETHPPATTVKKPARIAAPVMPLSLRPLQPESADSAPRSPPHPPPPPPQQQQPTERTPAQAPQSQPSAPPAEAQSQQRMQQRQSPHQEMLYSPIARGIATAPEKGPAGVQSTAATATGAGAARVPATAQCANTTADSGPRATHNQASAKPEAPEDVRPLKQAAGVRGFQVNGQMYTEKNWVKLKQQARPPSSVSYDLPNMSFPSPFTVSLPQLAGSHKGANAAPAHDRPSVAAAPRPLNSDSLSLQAESMSTVPHAPHSAPSAAASNKSHHPRLYSGLSSFASGSSVQQPTASAPLAPLSASESVDPAKKTKGKSHGKGSRW